MRPGPGPGGGRPRAGLLPPHDQRRHHGAAPGRPAALPQGDGPRTRPGELRVGLKPEQPAAVKLGPGNKPDMSSASKILLEGLQMMEPGPSADLFYTLHAVVAKIINSDSSQICLFIGKLSLLYMELFKRRWNILNCQFFLIYHSYRESCYASRSSET